MAPFEVTFCSTTAMEARKCKNCLKLWFCFLCWQIWLFIIVKSYNIVAAHLTRGKWKLLITCELKIAKKSRVRFAHLWFFLQFLFTRDEQFSFSTCEVRSNTILHDVNIIKFLCVNSYSFINKKSRVTSNDFL